MREIIFLPQAVLDLEEISEPLLSEIRSRIGLLIEFPYLGPVLEEEYEGFRCLNVGIVRVYYHVASEGNISILYIRHQKRQFPPIKE